MQSGGGNGGEEPAPAFGRTCPEATLRAITRTKLKLEGKRSAGGFKQPGPKTGGKGGSRRRPRRRGREEGGKGRETCAP